MSIHLVRPISFVAVFGLVANALTLALAPLLPLAVAQLVETRGWGLLSLADVPPWARILISIMFLDFIIYSQHVLFHGLPLLWRVHKVHHVDPDLDVSFGLRFHPVEILISLLIKGLGIVVVGAPVLAVLLFEIILNAASLFNHGNLHLPPAVDKILRLIIVTPDMHRVHRSVKRGETDSNFGFSVPWWDRLFGTYTAQPEAGHVGTTIGLKAFQDERLSLFPGAMILPVLPPERTAPAAGAPAPPIEEAE